jgi:hypothetical protein
MKPGSTTAPAADELETETETETETTEGGDADAGDAFEDALAEAVTGALEGEDDEDDDDIEVDGDELDDDDDEEDEDELEEDDEEEEEGDETKESDETEEGEAEKPAAGADAEKKGDEAAAGEPKWEAFAVKADKETFPIEEAQITRSNGNVFLAIPEKQFARFQARISRGVLYERVSGQLAQEKRDLEARKSAPARKSDSEIEAEITLEALKEHLAEIFDEKDMILLEKTVKLAQKEEAEKYAKSEEERIAKASEEPWEAQQAKGLALQAVDVWQSFPELKDHLSQEQVQAIYESELMPVVNSLYFKSKDNPAEVLANTQYIYDRLKAAVGKLAGGKKPASTGSTKGKEKSAPAPAPKGTPGKTASPAKGKTIAAADRFNRGVDAASRTTSVKANRTARPAKASTRDAKGKNRRRSPEQDTDRQARAEDTWRATERKFLSSDSLDFDDE